MSFKDGQEYPTDKVFTADELRNVTTTNVYEWMCHKTYGSIDPSPNDQPQKRATSLAYWKKAISYFMNSTSKWDEASQTGNPTQSILQ